ncbi:MAG: two-component system response regulator [Candidatus Wallbacteria bacterium HGW-Wallbacteria-1]|jgi:putative two-component system response regulator|uniref:Two-component system response regulator n=1 Tax=Candidatus Wallbacteria bacterium HGW-Wallbacteria-1 TaxID=2013854 RepID=A0A2N1PPJ8_9BACT|nr:MAG: two-component system response regulator [Candidatus Wallbacteria bacterium HGW-Wallbacteria-1]
MGNILNFPDLQQFNSRSRILIADSHVSDIANLRRLLLNLGYEVLLASDGIEAVGLIERDKPDLIILDADLPGYNGQELCTLLKNSDFTASIPVMIQSHHTDDALMSSCLHSGADDFLFKPYDRYTLQAKVRTLINMRHLSEELDRAERVIMALSMAVESRDPNSTGHSSRMAELGEQLGRALALSEDEIRIITRGAMIHDIGNVAVPESILLKPDTLHQNEAIEIHRHTSAGYNICKPLRSLSRIREIVRWHHEHLDGSGYPDGLRGDQIPVTVRVVSVLEVYDALGRNRPFRNAHSDEECREILLSEVRRGWWDSEIIGTLFDIL